MARAKQQFVDIEIPKQYNRLDRRAIAVDVLDFIVERTQRGKNKDNKNFPRYSKEYTQSKTFKLAGKGKNVNLTLTEEMLNVMQLLESKRGRIRLGYRKGDSINNKVEGNREGTYGQKNPIPGKERDFLGITNKDLARILAKYPLNDDRGRIDRASLVREAIGAAAAITGEVAVEGLEDIQG